MPAPAILDGAQRSLGGRASAARTAASAVVFRARIAADSRIACAILDGAQRSLGGRTSGSASAAGRCFSGVRGTSSSSSRELALVRRRPPKKSARPTRVHAWRRRSEPAAVAEPACCCWSSAAGRLSTPTTRSAISRATRTSGASTRARCPSSTFLAKACTRLPRRTPWRCRASCAMF